MKIIRLTPEEARRVAEALARVTAQVATFVDRIRAYVRAALPALRASMEQFEKWRPHLAAVHRGDGRPAWMSPFGPMAR